MMWYRSNPYKMPVPLLDLQRAIRYVKFHSKDFGIAPGKVGMVGFSAGGFEVAGVLNLLRGKACLPEGYVADEIDKTSDTVALAGLIYPCVTFRYNVPIMCAAFRPQDVNDEAARNRLIEEYDCALHIQKGDSPQFVCYGTDDEVLGTRQFEEYAQKLAENHVPHKVLAIPGVVQKWPLRVFIATQVPFTVFYLVTGAERSSRVKVASEVMLYVAATYLLVRFIVVLPKRVRQKNCCRSN